MYVEVDKLTFRSCQKEKPWTRRGMLNIISSVYDPIGFVSPFILNAKITLQRLCHDKIRWNEKLADVHIVRWNK